MKKKNVEEERSSCTTDAKRFAEDDFDLNFEPAEDGFSVHYAKSGEIRSTTDKIVVKKTTNKTESC